MVCKHFFCAEFIKYHIAMEHNLRLQGDTPANRVMKQYFSRRMTNAEPVRKASRRGRVLTTIPRLLQLDLLSLSNTARMNHFNVTELSKGTELEILRNRAQNQQLWRKGVDAIIEEYKRKWTGRETNRARYNPAAALGGGRQRARRGPGRPPGRRQQQGQRNITAYFGRAQT